MLPYVVSDEFEPSPQRSHSSNKNGIKNSPPKVAMIFCCKRFLLAVEEFGGLFSSVRQKTNKKALQHMSTWSSRTSNYLWKKMCRTEFPNWRFYIFCKIIAISIYVHRFLFTENSPRSQVDMIQKKGKYVYQPGRLTAWTWKWWFGSLEDDFPFPGVYSQVPC